jgi:very-short-patch-repair endonuclease
VKSSNKQNSATSKKNLIKNPLFSRNSGLYIKPKAIAYQSRLSLKKTKKKKHIQISKLKKEYFDAFNSIKEHKHPDTQNNFFLRFVRCFYDYNKSRTKPPSFYTLCAIANQIQRHASMENSIYLKDFSRKIFMQMYSMVMSDHPDVLKCGATELANSLFKLRLDPFRYQVKLQQYAKKSLLLITTNNTIENFDHASSSLWKLCLLANLYDDHLDYPALFAKTEKSLQDQQSIQCDRATTSALQDTITHRIMPTLSKEAREDVKNEYAVGPFIVDIALPRFKLIIEIDGIMHHHQNKGQRFRDNLKDTLLCRYGWEVIRIPSYEYHANIRQNKFNTYIEHILQHHPSLLLQLPKPDVPGLLGLYKTPKKHNPAFFTPKPKHGKRCSEKHHLALFSSLRYTQKIVIAKQSKKKIYVDPKDTGKARLIKSRQTVQLTEKHFPAVLRLLIKAKWDLAQSNTAPAQLMTQPPSSTLFSCSKKPTPKMKPKKMTHANDVKHKTQEAHPLTKASITFWQHFLSLPVIANKGRRALTIPLPPKKERNILFVPLHSKEDANDAVKHVIPKKKNKKVKKHVPKENRKELPTSLLPSNKSKPPKKKKEKKASRQEHVVYNR